MALAKETVQREHDKFVEGNGKTAIRVVSEGSVTNVVSTNVNNFPLDDLYNALITIDLAHHRVHDGAGFTVCDTVACNETTVKWMVVTPNSTRYAHMIWGMTSTGEATFLVTGDADRTAGTPLTVINRRRVGTPAVSETTVSRTPTSGNTDGATILFSDRNGATSTGSRTVATSSTRDVAEWILKPNTKYVISVTTYANVYVTCKLDWYELNED